MHIIDIGTGRGGEVEIAPCISIDTEEFGIEHTVIEITVLQTSSLKARRSGVFEIGELKAVEFSTYGSLNLQLRNDIIDDLSVHTEEVFVGLVFVLVDVPIGIDVVGVHTVPVLVLSRLGLIVFEPCLVIGSREGHEVLADIGFIVTEGGTVLYILMGVVSREIKIDGSQGCVSAEVERITAHVGFRQYIAVAHVGIGETYACLSGVHGNNRCVGRRQTELEEIGGVIRDNQERSFLSVEIAEYESSVGFRSPGLVGVADGIDVIHTIGTHAIDLLHVVPLAGLGVKSEGTVILHSPFGISGIGFLGGDKNDTVAGSATIECCCSRSFENRHRLDVIGVNCGYSVSQIIPAFCSGRAESGVIHRHTINDIEGLVITSHLRGTAQHDAR